MYFRIIIPTYGEEKKLEEAIASIRAQEKFENLARVIVAHDNTDYTKYLNDKKIFFYPAFDNGVTHIFSKVQRWNGGNRNFAMGFETDALYTLFLDHDDTIPDKKVLVKLQEFIEKQNHPDFIRLSYTKHYMNDDHRITKRLRDKTLEDVINSNKVAPWTKCVKTEKLPLFPENTVFEDVLHHLMTCDVCETYANFPDPVVEWRIWEGQTSTKKGPKWESSKFRFIADMMDFKPKKKSVAARREYRIKTAIETIVKENTEEKTCI